MGRDREPGPPGRPRHGPMHPLLPRRHPRLVRADLADDPRSHAALPHPVGRLADQLVGEDVDRPAIDERLGRVVRLAIPAAAHHDVETTRSRQADQPLRVATDPDGRHVHEPGAAGGSIRRELLEDQRLVAGQLPVIPAVGDVPERDLGVLVGQGEPERLGLDRAEDGLDVRHQARCYAAGTARSCGRGGGIAGPRASPGLAAATSAG